MPVKILVGLILCNLIWSMHPVMGKWLLEQYSPVQVAWIRYVSALAAYGIFAGFSSFLRFRKKTAPGSGPSIQKGLRAFFVFPKSWRNGLLISILGVMAFCLSPLLQNLGLARSLASENALIVAMEPVITVLFAWMILKERMSWADLIAFGFAILGFALLASPVSWAGLQDQKGSHFFGNLLILMSLAGEGFYSVLGKKMIRTHSPIPLFGTALTVGVVSLIVLTPSMDGGGVLPQLFQMSWKSFVAMLWIGPLGTAGAYLFYLIALSEVPVVSAVPFLFLQPVAGAFFGFLFLAEHLRGVQCFGGGLILLAVLFPYLSTIRQSVSRRL